MFEKLGRKASVLPLVVPILLICLFSLMFYPIANMEMRHLPFAVVCLDEGVDLPTGHVNAGEEMVAALESGDTSALSASADSEDGASSSGSLDMSEAIDWTVLSSEEELEHALENNEYYGAIVIPKGFTLVNAATQMKAAASESALDAMVSQTQMAQGQTSESSKQADAAGNQASASADAQQVAAQQSQQAQAQISAMQELLAAADSMGAEDSSLHVYLDKAKSPLIAQQLQSSMASAFAAQGVSADVTVVNDGGYDVAGSAMSGMMSQQLAILPSVLCGFIVAMLASRIFNVRRAQTRAAAFACASKQLALQVVAAAVVAASTWLAVDVVAGIETPFAQMFGFVWIASLCMMILFGGLFNLSLPFGALGVVAVLGFGNMCGVLPSEVLPAFWRDWIVGWVPQHYIGEGIRQVMYMGADAFNSNAGALIIAAAIGLFITLIAAMLPNGKAEAGAVS